MRRRPTRIDATMTAQLPALLPLLADAPPANVEMFVVKQRRGRAYRNERRITVPWWAVANRDVDYVVYYLAHELAHIAAFDEGLDGTHGRCFMEHFKRLCPQRLWHYELNYKPRFAKAAGITKEQAGGC